LLPCAGQRLFTFEAEVSRERVPLRNAYKAAGQVAVMRINGGEKYTLPVRADHTSRICACFGCLLRLLCL
jgi:hypothetical protein